MCNVSGTCSKDELKRDVQKHLQHVYFCVWLARFAGALGAATNALISEGWLFVVFRLFFLLLFGNALVKTVGRESFRNQRLVYLVGLSFFNVSLICTIVNLAFYANPMHISFVLAAISLMWLCFFLLARATARWKFIYIGATLSSHIACFFFQSVFGSLFHLDTKFNGGFHLTLMWCCGVAMLSTTTIISQYTSGERDCVSQAEHIVADFVVFHHLIAYLLAQAWKKIAVHL